MVDPPIVWPIAPDRPRIAYVGQLTGQADLDIRPSGWDALRTVIKGPDPEIAFSTPTAVAVFGERVFVADTQLGVVHVMDLERRTYDLITHAAGELLATPNSLAIAGERLAVSDGGRRAVFLFDVSPQDAAPGEPYPFRATIGGAELQRPTGVAWDSARRELWILDAARHACAVYSLDGTLQRTIGSRGVAPGEFNFPAGLTHDAALGTLVADSMNFRIQRLDTDGRPVNSFGRKGDAAGDFALPRGVAVDSGGHVYVLDSQFENVQVFDPDGRLLLAFGKEGQGPGEFYLPSGITIDDRDRIWVADTYNRRVQLFQYLSEDAAWAE